MCGRGCCNPFRGNVSEGVQNLENMHRSCLEGGVVSFSCLSATENISGSFAAPRKTVKTTKQRLWPNSDVAGRLAARGLFAARLCVYRTQHGQAHSVCWMEEPLPRCSHGGEASSKASHESYKMRTNLRLATWGRVKVQGLQDVRGASKKCKLPYNPDSANSRVAPVMNITMKGRPFDTGASSLL